MARSRYDCEDGSLPPSDPVAEAFCVNVAVHEMTLQDAFCAARGFAKSDSARVQAHRWKTYYQDRIHFLRDQRAATQEDAPPVDTSPQAIAVLQREISAALQEASRQAKAFGHSRLSNQIKASLVRHVGRVQRVEARRSGPVKVDSDSGEVQELASNIRRSLRRCECVQ